jgi:pimeloyl-ACP methyl ester carboxylesterase
MLREQLDGVNLALERAGLPPHKPLVLIGHSLGGLLAKMMVSESGDLLWNQFFRVAPDRLNLTAADRAWVERLMFFKPRHDIARVIFMASPFKGSKTADLILFRLSSRWVRFPAALEGHHYRVFRLNRGLMVRSKENRLIAERQPSSIDLLSPESPETIALSESSKSMSHASEPKLFGEHTRFSEALEGRKALEVVDKATHLMLQASILVISTEEGLRIPPEVFHGVEVGTAFGQPQQLDAERLGQAQGTLGPVTGVFI